MADKYTRTARQVLQRQAATLERRQAFLHGRLQGKGPDEYQHDRAELTALSTAIHLMHRELEQAVPLDPRTLGKGALQP